MSCYVVHHGGHFCNTAPAQFEAHSPSLRSGNSSWGSRKQRVAVKSHNWYTQCLIVLYLYSCASYVFKPKPSASSLSSCTSSGTYLNVLFSLPLPRLGCRQSVLLSSSFTPSHCVVRLSVRSTLCIAQQAPAC